MAIKVKQKNSSRAVGRLIGILLAIGVIVFVIITTSLASSQMNKTITVMRIKTDAGIPADSLITEDMVEPYDMYYKEYEAKGTQEFSDGVTRSVIVTWADKDYVIGQRYAAYYLHAGSELYWDMTLLDQTRKNSYLYSMDGELLNINMTTTDDFGDMVVPGDKLNIRARYTVTYYNIPEYDNYILSSSDSDAQGIEIPKSELLFSEVTILDMLNSSGSSIFDIYYQYTQATKSEQAEMLADDSFLESVQPASILLECTAEEVERYNELQEAGATYQITLLARDSDSTIYDSLTDIQNALNGLGNDD